MDSILFDADITHLSLFDQQELKNLKAKTLAIGSENEEQSGLLGMPANQASFTTT